jgi:hypothetical protein
MVADGQSKSEPGIIPLRSGVAAQGRAEGADEAPGTGGDARDQDDDCFGEAGSDAREGGDGGAPGG